jgi:hypothetical protein
VDSGRSSVRIARARVVVREDDPASSYGTTDRAGRDNRRHGPAARPGALCRGFDALAREPRVSATAIQTVGEKGYDGLALAVVL